MLDYDFNAMHFYVVFVTEDINYGEFFLYIPFTIRVSPYPCFRDQTLKHSSGTDEW